MRVTRIRAADFRNLPFADVDTDAPRVFLLGENGQGKTNLLEAAALVSAFRSFRTTEISPLIRMGCSEARLRLDVRHVTHWEGMPKGREGQALAWVAPDALGRYSMPPADLPVVAALQTPEQSLPAPGQGSRRHRRAHRPWSRLGTA